MKQIIKSTTILALGFATSLMADVNGIVTTDSNGTQTINYRVDMKPGWSMFSIPGYKAYKVQDILGDNTSVDAVYSYDSTTQQWMSFSTTDPSGAVTELVPGIGYWIMAKENIQLNFKSNIVQNGSYEIASITMNPNLSTQKDINITTESYTNMWTEDGAINTQFHQGYGSVDWSVARSGGGNMFWNNTTSSNDWMFTGSDGASQTGWSNYTTMNNGMRR